MSGTWAIGSGDAATVKAWEEKTIRDAEHRLIWGGVMYPSGPGAKDMIRNKAYGSGSNIIRVSDEFRNTPGDTLTITNVPNVNRVPVMGDTKGLDQSSTLKPYTMKMGYDAARNPFISAGKIQDKRPVINFRTAAKVAQASWMRRTTEGIINAHLYGITAPSNTKVLDRLNLPYDLTTVFGNAVQTFDSTHITYAGVTGANTSDANVAADTSATLSAALLDQLITSALEDLAIPLELADLGDGTEGLLVPIPGRGIEQLRSDPQFVKYATQFDGAKNLLLKRDMPRYGPLVFMEYTEHFQPAANVGRLLLLGKDALQFLKPMDWQWWEGVQDINDWFSIISVAAMMGAQATNFNGTRRNSYACDFYMRS